MKDWKKTITKPDATLLDAMKIIDDASLQIALIIDNNGILLGTLTDGDIRRALLNNISLNQKVVEVMNRNPITALDTTSNLERSNILIEKNINSLPIVDIDKKVISIFSNQGLLSRKTPDIKTFIMVGGLGTRLQELTKNCPKPLLKVGEKPILELIIERLSQFGLTDIVLCGNYKFKMIQDYFGNGEKLGITINYIQEEKRLGTAGAISLFEQNINSPILVLNGDILTNLNFDELLQFHLSTESQATMCTREYELQVPYGVIRTSENKIIGISEKPIEKYQINAGIYVLSPEILKLIPYNEYFDMTDLFQSAIENKMNLKYFQVYDYWRDIGQFHDYDAAQKDIDKI